MLEALVLAAGASTRMGQPKAALPLPDGHTFLSRAVHTLLEAGFPRVVVVTGSHDDVVRGAWGGSAQAIRFVSNPEWELGQLTSLLAGLDAVEVPALEGILVTLVDVPLVAIDTVRAITDAWCRTRAPVVRPARGGLHGHPVIFDRAVFDDLRRADRGLGAKSVVRRYAGVLLDVEVEDPGAFRDFDTPDAYRELIRPGGGAP